MLNLTVLVVSVLLKIVYVASFNLLNPSLFTVDIANNTVLGQCKVITENKEKSKEQNENNEEDAVPEFGILHTLEEYGRWAVKEEQLVELIKARIKNIKKEQLLMTRLLEDYEESSGEAIRNSLKPNLTAEEQGSIVASSAVLAHRMTSRYAGVVTQIRDLLSSEDYKESFLNISDVLELKNITRNLNWISFEDVYMSMTTFLHTEEVYWKKPEQMMFGLTIDTIEGGKLNDIHCAGIGMFALYRKRYFMALEWLELSEKLLNVSLLDQNGTHSQIDFTLDLTSALYQLTVQEHNRIYSSSIWSYETSCNVFSDPFEEIQLPSERIPNRQHDFDKRKGYGDDMLKANVQYFQLCLGEKLRPIKLENNLKCFYERKNHPFLYINPVKVEVLSEDPFIYQFYEVIGNKTIELLKEQNRNFVKLSAVVGTFGVENTTIFRTSAGTWPIFDETPRLVFKLAEYLSGLRIINNSETQFVEYTYGRFYTNHLDALRNESTEEIKPINGKYNNRLATMLYYLEVPQLGGITPFCQVGIGSNAVRGSVILWYNLYKNGTARKDVEHGSCPVLYGHKIIINHWIHDLENFNQWKCSLNQLE